jgi:Sulfotransferase family
MTAAWSQVRFLARRARQRVVAEVCSRAFRDATSESMRTAMLVGTARSGTTWVAELIDSQIPCRVMFEPFNPDRVEECRSFEYFQYVRPDDDHPALLAYCERLVRGQVRGRWIDSHATHVFPRFRLIKDIRPTLMLRWFHQRFREVPLLYLLRHPCAVVLSRMRLGWATDDDVHRFLRQPQLVSDYLSPYMDVIYRAQTDEEKHAIVWCISNLVPLRQFADGAWTLLRYEQLREQPEREVPRIFSALGIEFRPAVLGALNRPSRTTRASGRRDHGGAWTGELTTRQADRIFATVEAFGLDCLYSR